MRGVSRTAVALLLLWQCGCSAANRPAWLQEPGWNKPWTYRSGVASAVCAAVGAGAGVGVQEARTGTSQVCVMGQCTSSSTSISNSGDSTFWVWGALIGAASGAILCGVLGHVFLDPAERIALEPPPPILPPPPVAEPAPPAPIKQRIVLRGVNFDFNSADIRSEARPVLDQGAEILQANPGVDVRVEGHTDSIGSPEYNRALSVRRAEAVSRYLVNRGVDPERCHVEGFGESHPIASNQTEEGRAQNRRVELIPQQ
jgi:OOP family OmpA-OmpF porin